MKRYDTIKVGEDEGNFVVRRTLLGMTIGGTSAILLYGAIHGGFIPGGIFPDPGVLYDPHKYRTLQDLEHNEFIYNSLSIFWALLAGFSAKLFDGLLGNTRIET